MAFVAAGQKMLFTHMSDPDRDDYMDGDDYTYEQPELPGVAALAGLNPIEDLRRENAELRAALQEMAAEWKVITEAALRAIATIETWRPK